MANFHHPKLRLLKGKELTFQELDDNINSFYYSSSFSGSELKLYQGGSSGSFTGYTQSYDFDFTASHAISASYAATSSYAIIEVQKEISSSNADTASYFAEGLITASVSNNVITFTKDDSSTFNITVDTGSDSNNYIYSASYENGDINFFGSGSGFNDSVDLGVVISSSLHWSDIISASYPLHPATSSIIHEKLRIGDITGSSIINAELSGSTTNTIRFTKGDDSTIDLTIVTSSAGQDFVYSASYANSTLSIFGSGSAFNSTVPIVLVDSASHAEFADSSSAALYSVSGSSTLYAVSSSAAIQALSSSYAISSSISDRNYHSSSIDDSNVITFFKHDGNHSVTVAGTGASDYHYSASIDENQIISFLRSGSTAHTVQIPVVDPTDRYIQTVSLTDSTLTFISGGDPGAFNGTIDLSGISADEAKKVIFDVQVSGSDGDFVLQKGTPIHIVDNNNGSAIVIAASASVASAMPAHGILMQAISSSRSGTAAIIGEITGVNTSGFNSGDTVYVGASGGYTNVKPTGSNLIQNLGIVKKVDAGNGTGQIFGSGRSNDVPNINPGYSWVGNSSWVATPVATSSFYVDSSSYSISSSYAVSSSATLYSVSSSAALYSVSASAAIQSLSSSYAISSSVSDRNYHSSSIDGSNVITFFKHDGNHSLTVSPVSSYDLNIAGDTGTGVITDAETLNIVGEGGISTEHDTNTLTINLVSGVISGSGAGDGQGELKLNGVNNSVTGLGTSDSPTFAGLTVTGTLTSNELVTNIVSQSVAFATGSTIFGDELTDKHQFTGSLEITGSVSVQGTSLIKDIQRNSTHQHKLIISRSNGDGYELEINTGSAGGDGTVTRVGTGNGLTGGDITTSGDISVDYLSITTNLIKGASGGDIPETNDEIIFNNGSNAVVTASFSQIDLSIMNDDLDHGVTSVNYGDGLTGSASPITSTGTLRVKYSGDANVILAASNDSGNPVASTDYILTSKQTNNDVEYHSVDDLPFTNNNGTVTSVATTGGIKGGTITSAGTISLDYTTLGNNNFIMSASTITSAEDGDHILIADNSDSDIVRRITRANFVSGIGGSVTSVATNNGITGGTITTTGTIGLDLSGSDNYIFAGTDDSGGDNIPSTSVIAYSYDNTVRHAFVAELPFTNNAGDITAVNVSQGLYGGGTSGAVSIKPDWSGSADNTLYSYPYRVTSIADDDIIPFHDDSHGTDRTITFANFKNSVGGDITRVNISTGTGITGPVDTTSGDHTQTIGLDLSELTDMTAAVDGTQDEMILLDASVQKRKRLGEINLGQFNNDQGWTSNTGDITGVTAGLGLDGGGTTGTVTLNVSSSKFITVGSAVHVDLTNAETTTDPITLDDFFFIQDDSRANAESKHRKIKAADIDLSVFNDDIGAGTGDITAVNVSQGLYGGGTSGDVSIKPDWSGSADNTLYSYPYRVTSIADDDIIPFHDDSHGTDRTITFANFKSGLPQGDITGVTAGDGLSGGGASGAVSLAVNVDDVTLQITSDTVKAKTAAVTNGATTLATGDQIYDFVIGLGYTSNTGDITGVSAGNGLTGGATSGNATVTMGTPGSLSASTSNGVTSTSHTHAITTTTSGTASTIVQTDANSQITADNFITTSDKRLKSNIEPIKEGLETLKKFVSYEYELNGKQDAGFLAQEVQEHIPYAVNEKEDGYLAMNTKPIIAHIHKAILELDKRLSDIEQKLK